LGQALDKVSETSSKNTENSELGGRESKKKEWGISIAVLALVAVAIWAWMVEGRKPQRR
jgi:hypothetical protein